jgi:hypothetical protein
VNYISVCFVDSTFVFNSRTCQKYSVVVWITSNLALRACFF